MEPLPVIIASHRDQDRTALRAMLRGSYWQPMEAAAWEDALHLLPSAPVLLVLCDRDLPGLEWRDGVRRIVTQHQRAVVLLISPVDDAYLWEELVRVGGFDVLPRPLRADRTLAMLDFAYTHSRISWPAA